jgi:hypothetical protein
VAKNKLFLNEILLQKAIDNFKKISHNQCSLLEEIAISKSDTPKPKPRNVYKVDL